MLGPIVIKCEIKISRTKTDLRIFVVILISLSFWSVVVAALFTVFRYTHKTAIAVVDESMTFSILTLNFRTTVNLGIVGPGYNGCLLTVRNIDHTALLTFFNF